MGIKSNTTLQVGEFSSEGAPAKALAGLRAKTVRLQGGAGRDTPLHVFESLRSRQLAGSGEPVVKEIWGIPAGLALALTLLGSLSLVAILTAKDAYPDLQGEPAAVLEVLVLAGFLVPAAVSTMLAAWSVLKQLDFLQIMAFFSVPIACIAGWSGGIAASGAAHLSPVELLLSSGFCVSGLLALHSVLAYVFDWRLFWPFHAVATWLAYSSAASYRLEATSRLTAWLLLLAPTNEADQFGWRNRDDYDCLIEICKLERDGSGWRGLIVPALAALVALNLPAMYRFLGAAGDSSALAFYLGINPLIFIAFYLLAAAAWCHTLEMVVSGAANALIAMAAVQAKRALLEDPHLQEYGPFRTINLPNPAAVDVARVSWRIIDTARKGDGAHRCLIEKTAT